MNRLPTKTRREQRCNSASSPAKDDLCSEGSWTTDEGSTAGSSSGVRKLQWTDGSSYVGELDSQGRPHGHGKLVRNAGANQGALTYEGEWLHGEAAGEGVCTSPDFGTLSGHWQHNMVDGYARLVFEDGAAYEGEWSNRRPEGTGVFLNPHGIAFRGEWRNGVFQPQLSGYDPRGINTCNRQYNTEHQEAASARANVDANLAESRLQYNGVPGDPETRIDLVVPSIAFRKGRFDQNTGSFVYDSQEYESRVHPEDTTRTGRRLDSGYLYRSRYCTEVWGELAEEEIEQAAVMTEPLLPVKRAAVSKKEGYEESPEREQRDDEELLVEVEHEQDQPSKPATATCLTCPDPLSTYTVSAAAVSPAPAQFRSQSSMPAQAQQQHHHHHQHHPSPPTPQHHHLQQQYTPATYYQAASNYLPYMPGAAVAPTQYQVYPPQQLRISAPSSTPAAPVNHPRAERLSDVRRSVPEELSHRAPTERVVPVKVPLALEAVSSLELRMPKLKVNKVKVDYPVYAPRIIEVPVPAENLTPAAMTKCEAIQESLNRLSEPQSATTLDIITDRIVENLEELPNF